MGISEIIVLVLLLVLVWRHELRPRPLFVFVSSSSILVSIQSLILTLILGGLCGSLMHQRVRMLLFDEHKNTLALLRNETGHDFLCYILGRVVKELLELET